MASRKLLRDFLLSKQLNFLQLHANQLHSRRVRLISATSSLPDRDFGVLNVFSKKIEGEAKSNQHFQQSIKELKDKAGELKEVKEDLKERTKQTTEQLYKRIDGAWTEAEGTARKVLTNVKEKVSAATEEVKESLGLGKQDSSSCGHASNNSRTDGKDGCGTTAREDSSQNSKSDNTEETLYGRFKSSALSALSKVSVAFQKLKDAKVVDLAKKGYSIVKDELNGNASKEKRVQYASSSSSGERSTKTDIVVVPTKQSRWGKKWESFKDKMRGHPAFKRISGVSEPVVTKGQEFAEDMRERWETSDNPVVHKIQDLNESVFGETATAISFKEIRRRDPYFSLPEFVAEVQDMIKPTLNAYLKGDVEALKKTCSPEVIGRCKAERRLFESQGLFLDNKILHISELEIKETKLYGIDSHNYCCFSNPANSLYTRKTRFNNRRGKGYHSYCILCVGNAANGRERVRRRCPLPTLEVERNAATRNSSPYLIFPLVIYFDEAVGISLGNFDCLATKILVLQNTRKLII